MQFTIYIYPKKKEGYIGTFNMNNETHWHKWHKEQSRRIGNLKNNPNEKCFDIDECGELKQMSVDHLIEMLEFLKFNK